METLSVQLTKKKKEERHSSPRVDTLVHKNLKRIHPDLVTQFDALPPAIKKRITTPYIDDSEKRDISSGHGKVIMSIYGPLYQPTREETEAMFEEMKKEDRLSKGEYIEEDVEKMSPDEIEIRTDEALRDFMNDKNIPEELCDSNPGDVAESIQVLMNELWQDRSKNPNQIGYMHADKLQELITLQEDRKKKHENLEAEVQRWSGKKNRPGQKQFQMAQRAMADFNTHYGKFSMQPGRIREKIAHHKNMLKRQQGLSPLLKRMDALTFTQIISERVDRLAKTATRFFSESTPAHQARSKNVKNALQTIYDEIEIFYSHHKNDEALVTPLSEQKQKTLEKLSTRFRILLNRDFSSKNNPVDVENERHTIEKEMSVVLNLLKRF